MRKQLSTSIEESIIKELKVYGADTEMATNQVIENAINLYLAIAKNKTWFEIYDCTPATIKGAKLQDFMYNQQ